MGSGKRYDQEYKNMIVDLFKSGMSLPEISSEYGIAKSTINSWIKDVKEIKVDENEVMTLKEVKALKKEMARIKEENEILKKAMAIFATRN
ncbi:transposase IS3/IS911 family protein [Clostridium sartagoforme AAU1]|uniref:Transposase IS3/IS911 family protein n=1 Tax=Clostridium sartagoforme AAU1 TaxID=1202534 RepID=R9CFQ1_9CLOT|nr:transposase IS3/IS911 family protein [Clostridium sartagoforme AAU1]